MAKKQKVATLNAQVQGFYGRIIENLQAEITSLKIENENLKTDLRDLEFNGISDH
jgi:prefoldin subunit 5